MIVVVVVVVSKIDSALEASKQGAPLQIERNKVQLSASNTRTNTNTNNNNTNKFACDNASGASS